MRVMFYERVLLTRIEFMVELRTILEDYEALYNIERASFVLGCELCADKFSLLQ